MDNGSARRKATAYIQQLNAWHMGSWAGAQTQHDLIAVDCGRAGGGTVRVSSDFKSLM